MKEQFKGKTDSVRNPEQKIDRLDGLAAETILEINSRLKNISGRDVLDSDGSIRMRDNYLRKNNGPYSKEEIKEDERYVRVMEEFFSEMVDLDDDGQPTDNLKRLAYLKEKYGTDDRRILLERAKAERARADGSVLEKSLIVIMNRVLGSDYAVVKSSAYDDYKHKIDYLILNMKTGVVAAGFDAVNDQADGQLYEKKVKKIRRMAASEGAKVKYGLNIESNENGASLRFEELNHIPTYCLGLDRAELNKLLQKMNYSAQGRASESELNAFGSLLDSLDEQNLAFEKDGRLNREVREKLPQVNKFINTARELSKNY